MLVVKHKMNMLNVFKLNGYLANVPILYPLKTPENQTFFGVFLRFRNGNIGQKKVNNKNKKMTAVLVYLLLALNS